MNVKKICRNLLKKIIVKEIHILGGETLLHATPEKFAASARKAFPNANIYLFTNGILIPKLQDNTNFWKELRRNNVTIAISCYPPFKHKVIEWVKIIKSRGVKVLSNGADYFEKSFDRDGKSNPKKMYEICPNKVQCPQLRNGRMYTCARACYLDYYNAFFNTDYPVDQGIDIYKNSGKEIHDYILKKPKEVCRYCKTAKIDKWDYSKKEKNEWDA